MSQPSISIVTATLNAHLPTFTQVLDSIKKQKYTGQVEHIVLDGGSTNGTIELANKYNSSVLSFHMDGYEGGKRLYAGLQRAQGELILILESDNILTHSRWLSTNVLPFQDKRVFSVYPMFNSYTDQMSALTRYYALLGTPDPTLYYLNKTEKVPHFIKKYNKGIILEETKQYYIVKFTADTLPPVGDNGYLVQKRILQRVVHKNLNYIHVDAFYELLLRGFDTYGVTKDSIIHVAAPSLIGQIKRRIQVKEHFTNEKNSERIYFTFNPYSKRDILNILKFMVYSVTFIQPLFVSIRGYLHTPDLAWFLHPVVCFLMVCGYSFSEIKWQSRRWLTNKAS